ncbi:unnamed protein product [Adineta steineri]|uniref:Uncharacterized protein n=1 Tax=Adineta steineri TaxID=433720 RepID=A0A814MN60_9BILA|nr:unnamed protein product [Adineta steineri]
MHFLLILYRPQAKIHLSNLSSRFIKTILPKIKCEKIASLQFRRTRLSNKKFGFLPPSKELTSKTVVDLQDVYLHKIHLQCFPNWTHQTKYVKFENILYELQHQLKRFEIYLLIDISLQSLDPMHGYRESYVTQYFLVQTELMKIMPNIRYLHFIINNHDIQQAVNARVTTKYTNGLYSYSSTFVRPNGYTKNYYFHAIKVRVFTTGLYSFTSNSTFDTYGSFHHYPVELTNSSKSMIAYNDDSGGGGREFQINLTLQSNKIYVLLVTTYSSNVTGLFTIIVEGPSNVELIQNDYFVLESTTTTIILPMITSTYSGFLSYDNFHFNRPTGYSPNHYYQAIEITATMSGTYIFISNSSFDTYGYFYDGSFDPIYPSLNLIALNDNGGGNLQFCINVTLQFQHKYILVITSFGYNIIGTFLVKAIGPTSLNLTPINPIIRKYDDRLSCSSSKFSRMGSFNDHGCYFYQAYRIETSMNGFYTFFSNSSMDTYGYLYNNSFDPSRPSLNLIESNDNGATNLQFRISSFLHSARKYILVVTTNSENIQVNFRITAVGPSWVYFSPITLTTDRYQLCDSCKPRFPGTSSKVKTVAIVVPILIVLIITIIGCCISRCNRKRMFRHHQNVQTGMLSIPNIQRIEIAIPYTISLTRTSDRFEEQPPSYESVISSMRIQR